MFRIRCIGGLLSIAALGAQAEAVAPLLDGLVEELSKEYSEEPTSAVEQALANALTLSAQNEGLPVSDLSCNRDYSLPCPEGWTAMEDGDCSAPTGYDGMCPSKMSFAKMTPKEKGVQASKCSTSFPCVGAYAQDYSQSCPEGWTNDVGSDCFAPTSYTGPCVTRKSFVAYGESDKASWAHTCGVAWPSMKHERWTASASSANCAMDYSKNCPENWTSTDGFCRAPADYSGSCVSVLPAGKYTSEQKRKIAETCNAPWPCN